MGFSRFMLEMIAVGSIKPPVVCTLLNLTFILTLQIIIRTLQFGSNLIENSMNLMVELHVLSILMLFLHESYDLQFESCE